MAPPGPDNQWQKDYFNTNSAGNSQSASRSGSYDAPIIYGDNSAGLESGGLNIKHNNNVPQLDLNASWHAGDDNRTHLSPDGEQDDTLGGRKRNKSISFDPEAKLDNGEKHALTTPLPRTGSLRSVSTADRPNSRRGPSAALSFDPATCKINPFTGEPVRRRPRRQDTGSSLSIMDAFAQNHAASAPPGAQFASLTSESTISPPQDEAPTPGSPDEGFIDSPTAVSSPAFSPGLEGEPWPAFRNNSVRSSRTLPSRPLSLRRESRRSSRRSASSSFSPASAFLSKWGRDSMAAAPEADEEGQGFGLEGEYIIGRQIGYGGFSVVKEAFLFRGAGEKRKFAVKIVRKVIRERGEAENERCQASLEHEVGIWKYLSDAHILSLHAVFDTDFATFCVMDLNEGGSLYDLVRDTRKMPTGTKDLLTSGMAGRYAKQLAEALRYLHQDVRVVHRDVKMENCLISNGHLRLCDFGLADFVSGDSAEHSLLGTSPLTPGSTASLAVLANGSAHNGHPADADGEVGNAANVVGSLEYAAPEILCAKEGAAMLHPAVDIWAYGVCVFTLVTGDRPFKHSLAARVVELIVAAKWDEEIVLGALGDYPHANEVVELLKGCLDVEAGRRWKVGKVLKSGWFTDGNDS